MSVKATFYVETSPLGEAITIKRGISWDQSMERAIPYPDTYPVLRIPNIQETLELDDLLYLAGITTKRAEQFMATKGWTILVGSNGNPDRVGNPVYIDKDEGFLFASFLIAVAPNEDANIDPKFLYHFLKTPFIQQAITDSVQGTTGLKNLSQRFLSALPLPKYNRDEQRRIADILDTVDAAIQQTEALIAKLKLMKAGLLHDLLTRGLDEQGRLRDPSAHPEQFKDSPLGRIPREWEISLLGSIAEIGSGVTLGRNLEDGPGNIELPYLRVANVQDGYLDLTEIKTVRIRKDELARYLLQAGDVLMNEGGDFDKLGRGTVWEGQIAPCLHQNHVFRVRVDQQKLYPHFLAAVSGSTYGKRFFVLSSKQSTNLASINSTQLRAFPIPYPSLKEQKQILDALDAHNARIHTEEAYCDKLKQLKQGLMRDLLTGRVRVRAEAGA